MVFGSTVVYSCELVDKEAEATKNRIAKADQAIEIAPDTAGTETIEPDTFALKETFQEDDLIVNEYLKGKLKPIRENFKRINSRSDWTSIDTKELWGSTEGGEAKFYHENGTLEKIVTRNFGEMGQTISEYYLYHSKLSFVFERSYTYNRPFYWDTTEMRESNDGQVFEFERSEINENRSYFDQDRLVHQVNSDDCGSPYTDEYLLLEHGRLMAQFEDLLERIEQK